VALTPGAARAWGGFDYDAGSLVEIEPGNLVPPGESIEVYAYGDGAYHDFDVDSIQRDGGSVEIQGFDNDTRDDRTLDMDE
jgi:hypothetical protein